jgi:acetyl esterase/lipase
MVMRSLILFLIASCCLAQRPLRHGDYDSWNTIASPKVSDNGRFLIYGLFPQEGDGLVVIRDLNTEAEIRQPAGVRPAPPPPDFSGGEESTRQARGVTAEFTADGLFAIFQTFPTKEESEKAGKGSEKLAGDLVVVNLATGQLWRIKDVKSFRVAENSAERFVYLKQSGELVVRSLLDNSEVSFPDVAEYELRRDGAQVVFLTKTGAYGVSLPDGDRTTLAEGEGKYGKLAGDESGRRYAFLRDSRVYLWSRDEASAVVAVENASTFGKLSFSPNGERLFFGLPPEKASLAANSEAVFDLWHYRDEYVQPMQRVRAKTEREWSESAVYHVAEQKVAPLGGGVLTRLLLPRQGIKAVGLSDRPYRRIRERETGYYDMYAVDLGTGSRQLMEKRLRTAPVLSPDGRYAVGYAGKTWVCWDLESGIRRDLTGISGREFFREDHDLPQDPPAYGQPIWTKDSRLVLIPDRFDVWAFAPDGSQARNLTDGVGRDRKTELRVVALGDSPKDPGIDPAKAVLLRAEDIDTRETGFYREGFGAEVLPEKLVMGPMNYRVPIQAKDANVLVVAASKFNVFPDLQVTNADMKVFQKVTNANRQTAEIAWGTGELIRYRNGDGKELSAALYKPAGFDPSRKYPLLVYIYERLSQNVHNFTEPRPGHSINVSYYTSNGYVVLMPDIVYTIGYPGASALKCVVPAVQRVVEMGFVDPERVGIQGHSWGGYQIAYMITQTNIFRAAAPGALVANMISAYDGIRWGPGIPRQFQYEKAQSRIGGTPWEYPMRYIENSPIFMADRVNTPVLMLHNDADDAVPWYQGIEFFLALRRLDKEVYFFNYNGEGHGLRKRANQKDYTVRLQQFFDHYLKGASKPEWMTTGRPFIEKGSAAEINAAAPSDN